MGQARGESAREGSWRQDGGRSRALLAPRPQRSRLTPFPSSLAFPLPPFSPQRERASVAQVAASRATELDGPPSKSTAEARPNAYLGEDMGLPKPYGSYAPFKPTDAGVSEGGIVCFLGGRPRMMGCGTRAPKSTPRVSSSLSPCSGSSRRGLVSCFLTLFARS